MSIAQKNPASQADPLISVVVPAFNEAENVENLASEIAKALFATPYEMIFIDDASTDETKSVLVDMKSRFPYLRVLSHRENSGQSRGVRDGQNDPADIPALYAQMTRTDAPDNLGMVGGRRAKRIDSAAKKVASRFGNGVRKRLLRDEADDTGCGLKLFRRDAFLELPYFDHIHRYIPALMLREGYAIEFADVNHRAREFGESKYTNFGRLKVSIADLRGVIWLRKRMKLPGGVDEL
jgi:glycosyltransferase involved in cell wall biosynthesis